MNEKFVISASKEFWYEIYNTLVEKGDQVHQDMATLIVLELNKQMPSKAQSK